MALIFNGPGHPATQPDNMPDAIDKVSLVANAKHSPQRQAPRGNQTVVQNGLRQYCPIKNNRSMLKFAKDQPSPRLRRRLTKRVFITVPFVRDVTGVFRSRQSVARWFCGRSLRVDGSNRRSSARHRRCCHPSSGSANYLGSHGQANQ